MKITLGICFFVAAGLSRAADLRQIQGIYQAVLQSEDDSRFLRPGLPNPEGIEDDSIKALTAEDVKALLPLAQRCWQSSRPGVVRAGFGLLIMVSLRRDSTMLLEPYIDDLAKLLTAPEEGVRGPIVYILGSTQPVASLKAIGYLVAHLADKNNTGEELRTTAAAILRSRPSDTGTIHRVLAVVEQRPEFNMKVDVIQMLGLYVITNEEALQFVRSGLNGDDRGLRPSSIDAVARLPKGVRDGFARDLQRIANDAAESPAVRSRAASVLTSQ